MGFLLDLFAYFWVMNSQLPEIKKTLEGLKPGLSSKYAVNSIGLFGSAVRDDFNAKSDIDIIVDLTRPVGIEFIDLADELENKLHRKVDLVSKNGIKEKYFRLIEPEIIYV
jgi:predicted nucleotidyltransferase